MPVLERTGPEYKVYSKAELENHPYVFKCESPNCYGAITCKTIEEGITLEQRHTCGEKIMKTPRHVNEYLLTKGGIATMWSVMDSTFDRFRSMNADHPEKEYLKNNLSGMAEMLFIAMKPYFANRDAIVQEVMARARARDTGEEHITPGIGWVAITPEDGGTPWEKAFGSSGYTAQPESMAEPPYGYPLERVEAHRTRMGYEKQADGSWKDTSDRRSSTKSAASTPSSAYKPPSHLTPELINKIKEQKAAGFDDKMLMMGHNLKAGDLRWALSQ